MIQSNPFHNASGTLQVYFFTVIISTRNELKNVQVKKLGRMNEGKKERMKRWKRLKETITRNALIKAIEKDGSKLINTQIGERTAIKWEKNYTKEK
jgi:hypothetical protein